MVALQSIYKHACTCPIHFMSFLMVRYITEIVKRVSDGETPPFRPREPECADKDYKQSQMSELMEVCWKEDPDERPSLDKVKSSLKNINKGM